MGSHCHTPRSAPLNIPDCVSAGSLAQYRAVGSTGKTAPPAGALPGLAAQEGQQPSLRVGAGGWLQGRAEDARLPQHRVVELPDAGTGVADLLGIDGVVLAGGAGQIPA